MAERADVTGDVDDITPGARAFGRRWTWLAAASSLATTAATFGPWGRSGARVRSSYELVDVADRAGVLPGSTATLAPVWFLVPALCGVVVLALAMDHRPTVGVGATTLGVVVGVGGVLVARSPLGVEAATWTAVGLALCTVTIGVATLATSGKERAG